MILHNPNSPSYLSQCIENFWLTFKGKITAFTNTQWNDEDYKGTSFSQWRVMQYYNVLYLLILIEIDIEQNGTVNNTWQYYVDKYDLNKKKECLACEGINLDDALATFNFPFRTRGRGIQVGDAIESSFTIEEFTRTEATIVTIDINNLLNNLSGNINNVAA